MIRRARLLSVVALVVAGGAGVISSTQTWLVVTLADGSSTGLPVAGAAAVPVLAPLSLAVLALGLALSIVGTLLRYVFGVLTVAAAVVLLTATVPVVAGPPVSAVAPTVTEATGIGGADAVGDLVASIALTPWPFVALVAWALLAAAGLFTLVTARRWRGVGRRFTAESAADAAAPASSDAPGAPLDAIDSWDGLSRGEDPTASGGRH